MDILLLYIVITNSITVFIKNVTIQFLISKVEANLDYTIINNPCYYYFFWED